ncbi:MAG: DUF3987 domain-containing protein [Bosea sp.]|uniref:DUF3987 domain-containing protein n=1 Tax=Bosea sp. (in: a-proteobacteria) TaxID=1871050 RepID=UPI001AD0FA61|nr:DUF3987 domain-containing protein [Bosea sp. (in: a-proteobacteria)]MBN9452933.1 DUF3987 domain-containing protein [Bosea sp. (in: a-proteobacteria)]
MSNTIQSPSYPDHRLTLPENIPHKLRTHAQFILYKVEHQKGKLLKRPYSALDPNGSSINPLDATRWVSFDTVVDVYAGLDQSQYGIGFVLTQEAGITCFDLDAKDDAAAFSNAVEAMSAPAHATWGETSVSGNGRHYFYLGSPSDGTPSMNDVHPNIEVYCSKRFIALTGRVLPGSQPDLTDGDGIVAHTLSLRAERRKERIAAAGTSPLSGVTYELGRGHMSNERALLLMSERKPLSYGHLWQAAPQGTGSERLMQVVGDLDKILADPEQIYQIVESSPLGQSRCNSLYRKFFRYWLPDARGGQRRNTEGIWNRTQEEQAYLIERGQEMALAFAGREVKAAAEDREQVEAYAQKLAETPDEEDVSRDRTIPETQPRMLLEYPPGLTGQLAFEFGRMQHYHNQSLAVLWAVSTIGAFAQRSYFVKGAALNTYIMALGYTGEGKDLLGSGRTRLLRNMAEFDSSLAHVTSSRFFGPGEYKSGPAMTNTVAIEGRTASVLNEASFLFEGMGAGKNEHASSLRHSILFLKTKAGQDSMIDSIVYADKVRSIPPAHSPSLSLLCEGQPRRFYRALGDAMAEDGLLNRFEVFDVSRPSRGDLNRDPCARFSESLLAKLRPLIAKTGNPVIASAYPVATSVSFSPEADKRFWSFYQDVVHPLNQLDDPYRYNLFVRAHVTAWVYAAILAVADNPIGPTISGEHARWALRTIYAERQALLHRFATGDVGTGEDKRKAIVIRALQAYGRSKSKSINVGEAQHKAGMVQQFWLSQKVAEYGKIEFEHPTKNRLALIEDIMRELGQEASVERCTPGQLYDAGDGVMIAAPPKGVTYRIVDLKKYKKF